MHCNKQFYLPSLFLRLLNPGWQFDAPDQVAVFVKKAQENVNVDLRISSQDWKGHLKLVELVWFKRTVEPIVPTGIVRINMKWNGQCAQLAGHFHFDLLNLLLYMK